MAKWEKNKGWYKIINAERPGDPIEVGFNGRPPYQFIDGAVAEIPHAVADAINNAVKVKHEISGKDGEARSVRKTEVQRYYALPQEKPKDANGNSLKKEIFEEKAKGKLTKESFK